MNIQASILIGSLIYTLLNLAKLIRARSWNGAVTIVVGFAIGVVVVLIASQASIANSLEINGTTLGQMDLGSLVLVGLVATSLFSSFYDLKSAIDGRDTARMPSLVTPPPPQD